MKVAWNGNMKPLLKENFKLFRTNLAKFVKKTPIINAKSSINQSTKLETSRENEIITSSEGKIIKQPADIFFKTMIFTQFWLPTLKPRDQRAQAG